MFLFEEYLCILKTINKVINNKQNIPTVKPLKINKFKLLHHNISNKIHVYVTLSIQ